MSFGQELKDFTAGFNTTYNAMADRRDKKWQRDRAAIEDPIDNEAKKASTEGQNLRNKWYDKIADINTRSGEKSLEWADRDHQSVIDARDASLYANVFGGRGRGKPGETLTSSAPDGSPDASGAPVGGAVGDHGDASGAIPDDSSTDAAPDTDTGGDDTGGDETPQAENMSYHPATSQSEIYSRFMRTVYDSGVKNPNGLAAIAATANRESKFAPSHAYGSWSDPSERGVAGTSGGIMSWRGDRYTGLQQFAARMGDDPRKPSPETQAKYLFHEDPSLKDKLNSARTPEQAQQIMNNAWAFAGYDKDTPERRARRNLADTYAQKYNEYLGGTQALATGGYVVHAATGGAIPALPDDEDKAQQMQVAQAAPQPTQQALPVDNAPVPTDRPNVTPEGNATPADVGYDPSIAANPRVVGFTKAHEAVLDGIRYSLQQVGLDQGAAVTDPDRAKKMSQYLMGAGAAPKAVIDQAYDKVDPKHELPDSERTMAALGMVYDHYVSRGEAGKAKAAAASIIQYQRKLFQQYSAIAKAAVADGDIDAATKAAVKAYDSVPDGQGMKVKKLENGRYQIDITDEATGNTISKPVLTPQEIGGWAMKVSPGSFDQFIMEAAGQRKQGGGAPSDGFQKLAAGLDKGVMPSNEDMASLPLAEQKELRMRTAAAAKAQGGGEDKPLSFGDAQTAKTAIATEWENMTGATTTDEKGNEVPLHMGMGDLKPEEASAIKASAANIFGTPKNRSPDYDVSEQDAISAAFMVAQAGPDQYKVKDAKGGKVIGLPDGTEVWMTAPDFTKMSNIYKRHVSATKKQQQDSVNAKEDKAARDKKIQQRDKDVTDNPNLFGDQSTPSPLLGNSQNTIDDLQKLMQQ
jgi:hypothetical protein